MISDYENLANTIMYGTHIGDIRIGLGAEWKSIKLEVVRIYKKGNLMVVDVKSKDNVWNEWPLKHFLASTKPLATASQQTKE